MPATTALTIFNELPGKKPCFIRLFVFFGASFVKIQ